MRTHTFKGRMVIDAIIRNFQFENISNINVLRNIAEYHYDALNSSGYPHGLKAEDKLAEARIITVADFFDALTSERPYKKAWSNELAFETIEKKANDILDIDCVNALLKHKQEIAENQNTFKD